MTETPKTAAQLAAELRKAVALAGKAEEARFKALHAGASNLRVRTDTIVYKPRGKEQKEAPAKAVALLLREPSLVGQSNKVLHAALLRETGVKVPVSILVEPFSAANVKRIAELLKLRKVALDLSEHDTPSKVKKALRAQQLGKAATSSITVTFAFTHNAVVVGDKTYSISGSTRRINFGNGKINADMLQRLVMGGQ